MRKPRDYDTELKALNEKAKRLRDRRLVQLGELVIAIGADTLPIELLAGVLLAAKATSDAKAKEEWRQRGAAFFQRGKREAASRHDGDDVSPAASASGTKSSATSPGLL